MNGKLTNFINSYFDKSEKYCIKIGEILINRRKNDDKRGKEENDYFELKSEYLYVIRHLDFDIKNTNNRKFINVKDANNLVLKKDDGSYRYLKSGLGLSKNWFFEFSDLNDVIEVINIFYPTGLSFLVLNSEDRLPVFSLKSSINRMVNKFGVMKFNEENDEKNLVAKICNYPCNCLKTNMWGKSIDDLSLGAKKITYEDGCYKFPLLCPEPCNYFLTIAYDEFLDIRKCNEE